MVIDTYVHWNLSSLLRLVMDNIFYLHVTYVIAEEVPS